MKSFILQNTPCTLAMWSDEHQVDGVKCYQGISFTRRSHSDGGMHFTEWVSSVNFLYFETNEKRQLEGLRFRTKAQMIQWLHDQKIFSSALREMKKGDQQ